MKNFDFKENLPLIGIWTVVVIVVGLLGFLIADIVGTKTYMGIGYVANKKYSPPYTTMEQHHSGKITTYIPVRHPEKYRIIIRYKEQTTSEEVPPMYWHSVEIGYEIKVRYSYGRYTKSLYIKDVIL